MPNLKETNLGNVRGEKGDDVDTSQYYNKTEEDSLLNAKANVVDVTTLTTRVKINEENITNLNTKKANTSDVYTQNQMDSTLNDYSTTSEVNTAITSALATKDPIIVTQLPSTGDSGRIYAKKNTESENTNNWDIFIFLNNAWEKIDDWNLNDYYTQSQIDTFLEKKMNSVDGYTKTEIDSKISNIDLTSKADKNDLDSLTSRVNTLENGLNNLDTYLRS